MNEPQRLAKCFEEYNEQLKALTEVYRSLSLDVMEYRVEEIEKQDGEEMPDHRVGDLRDHLPSDQAVTLLDQALERFELEIEDLKHN